jgi:hypothetical protein
LSRDIIVGLPTILAWASFTVVLARAAPGPLLAPAVGANSSVAHLLLTLLLDVVG